MELGVVDPGCYVDRIEIARGGMGRISRARDLRLDRIVALKELCIDQRETRARLAREALLTARLSHPSIVSVHEAGQWPGGMPFYAMKLVPGRSLDRVIDDRPTLASRLALLPHILAVADALAYAHQQRVIHRDLKPHNVLVGEFGETVVIDWGLAKDLTAFDREEPSGPHPIGDAATTVDGAVIGTPAYMPPEQAAGEPVDERADVYAIGAMLYHLLAGHAPYGKMAAVAVVETLQEEPPPPLAELQPHAPADLLAIVARAMSRDPDDRYETARGLADDLHRFHTGQLVGARRYSWRDLARRWLRRNRRAVAFGAASLLVLLAFGVVTLTRIIHAEQRAQSERAKADRHRADAEELLEFMLGDLREKLRPLNQLGLLESVAHKARDYFEHRPDDLESDDLRKHALALINLGDVMMLNGHSSDASAEYERALQLARGLVMLSPASPQMRDVLANAYIGVGDVARTQGNLPAALAAYREAVAVVPLEFAYLRDVALMHGKVGDALAHSSDPDAALIEFRTELAVRSAVATVAPNDRALLRQIGSSHLRIGNVLARQKNDATALVEFRTGRQILEAIVAAEPTNSVFLRELATAHERVGAALDPLEHNAEALAEIRAALAIRERLAAADPTNAQVQRDLSVAHFKIADLLADHGDLAGALAEYKIDFAITDRLAAQDPANLDTQRDLLVSHSHLGSYYLLIGKDAQAVDAFRDALALAERISAKDPANPLHTRDVLLSHRRLGEALEAVHDRAGALVEFRSDLALVGTLVARGPNNTQWKQDLERARAGVVRLAGTAIAQR